MLKQGPPAFEERPPWAEQQASARRKGNEEIYGVYLRLCLESNNPLSASLNYTTA